MKIVGSAPSFAITPSIFCIVQEPFLAVAIAVSCILHLGREFTGCCCLCCRVNGIQQGVPNSDSTSIGLFVLRISVPVQIEFSGWAEHQERQSEEGVRRRRRFSRYQRRLPHPYLISYDFHAFHATYPYHSYHPSWYILLVAGCFRSTFAFAFAFAPQTS